MRDSEGEPKKKLKYERPMLADLAAPFATSANCNRGSGFTTSCRNGYSASANNCGTGTNPYNAGCAAGNKPGPNYNCRVGTSASGNCRTGNKPT